MKLTTNLQLVPRLRIGGAIPLLRLHDDERYFTLNLHHISFSNPYGLIPLCTLGVRMTIKSINKTFVFTNNIQTDILYTQYLKSTIGKI
jgi:hypothetical protein